MKESKNKQTKDIKIFLKRKKKKKGIKNLYEEQKKKLVE